MSELITASEYRKEIVAIVQDVREEIIARGDENLLSDILHEIIDNHQWVIYT